MKRLSLYLLLASFVVWGAGCKKFLEEKNPSSYTSEQYYTSPEQAQAAVNELYAGLRFITDGAGTYGESPYLMLEFPTGLCQTQIGQSQWNNTLRGLSTSADNNYFYVWWQYSYQGIANANLGIARIPAINMDSLTKASYLGQLHFMRAFHYFNLVRMFGDVPYLTQPVSGASDPNLYIKRTSQDSIYSLIVSDLTAAEQSGLAMSDQSGRVSLGAVKSLLASVYLTMAGYPLNKGQEYYQKAADKANEVIQSGAYSLFPDYNSLHDPSKRNTGEFIFQNQYSVAANITNSLTAFTVPRSLKISTFADEYGVMYPVPEFFASYEPGDKRTQERQFYFSKYPSINPPHDTVNFGDHYIYKYFDSVAATSTAQSDLNYTFLRYAEVLLTFAEASNEAAGAPSAAAYAAVNAIRRRAQLPDLSGLNQQQFREAVWRERYHELAFENKTWFDMIRTRKVYNLTNGTFDNFVGHKFTYGNLTLSEKYLLFGIPSREIANNKLLTQNPGW